MIPQKLVRTIKTKPWAQVLLVLLVWKICILAITTFAVLKQPVAANPLQNPTVAATTPLQATIKWDSYHYLEIAEHGYGEQKGPLPAFFPLFPGSVAAISSAGISPVAAGFIINTVATYFAFLFLYLLALEFLKDSSKALRAVLLFAFFPFAYFLHAFYSEALFCAVSFGAFYFARQRRWWAAGLMLALVTAIRLPGLLVVLAVLVEYADSRSWNWRKLDRNALWLLLAPLGLLVYMAHLNHLYGDPLFFKSAYAFGWGYQHFQPNILATLANEFGNLIHGSRGLSDSISSEVLFFGSWLIAAGILIRSVRILPVSYTTYGLGSLVLFVLNSNVISANRYILPLFPLYLIMALWTRKSELLFTLLLAGSATALGLFATLFANGYWTG